ncbi:Aliphatic sulfonates import ATP-binding protein SsuB [Moorella humiferrea]|uniref:Aliphatic sulfonates import ATP-binding protein SsuB n=2 Tax=Neomoorella humiferrea TaxID=676965 RepID=A0A2T0AYS3_9FIRM|nr:Aliphatic sulfonates import ATP-binding protein SsuB [Moorella humiferrea]
MPWRTVKQNVAYGMEIKKVPKEELEERLEKILELVGLTSCADLYPNQISASMEQRVAIARAFVVNPDILLMDEPYGQLDIKLRYYLEDELIRIWKELKSTVIFVTHNIEEAVYLAERILVLTNKPTTIKEEVIVDLPRPRDFRDPQFVAIRKRVTDLIKWW